MTFRIITFFAVLLIFPNYICAQLQRPSLTVIQRTGAHFLRKKPTKEQKKRLAPNAQDLAKYRGFLEKPRTGIFRLMPDIGCTANINIIRADAACLNYIPESSYYSFREKEHSIEMLSDIRLRNGYLISDGILSQSILVHLGETELEEIAPTDEALKFLSRFSPNAQGGEAQKQYLQLIRGVKTGSFEYKKALPVIENAAYALRVIAYKGNIFRSFRGYRFDILEGDKRIDITLIFRVIRKEQDGSVTLLWKEIERRDAPRLILKKKRKK